MLSRRSLLPALLLSLILPLVVDVQPAAAASADWEAPIDLTFPVVGDDHSYMNDYHFPRSRGAHGATDIMAASGTPIVAAMGGTITWMSTPATSGCGYCLDIRGTDGRTYGYIHLGPKAAGRTSEAFTRDWRVGDRVGRGDPIGYVGCSGNASCAPGGPHLHFFIEDSGVRDPYGDARRNPYASLRAAECGASGTFSDVCAGSTHEADIERLVGAELTYGCGDGTMFCPLAPVTRAQMASFLVRALELQGIDRTPFRDVRTDNVHYRTIARLAEERITRGCADDRFCPADRVTRAQMASFLVRALELPAAPASMDFADVRADNIHRADIEALAAAGITRGCGGESFCPDDVVTRQQMASFLVRAFLD